MRLEDSILKKSLQELDGQDWGEPTYHSHLVTEYHRLRRVPLEKLNVENLRLLIGQSMSLEALPYLLPVASEHLLREPWAAGDYYEGDLLQSVLGVPAPFWHFHPELKCMLDQIVRRALLQVAKAEPQDVVLYDANILQLLQKWQ